MTPEEGWPESTSDVVVEQDAGAEMLFVVAGAYQAAQSLLATRTQLLTLDRWNRDHPVNDEALGQWMAFWDARLASASEQQARLTSSYVDSSLRRFGIRAEPPAPSEPPAEAVEAVEVWLDSEYADLDEGLHREAEELLGRLRAKEAGRADLARADRLPWLHSPVIKVRTGLSQGVPVDAVFETVSDSIDASVDAALREVESDVVSATKWPRFQDGKALLAKRLPQAGACGWCRVVATRLYSFEVSKRAMAWHSSCRCVWALVTFAEARTYEGALKRDGNYLAAAKALGLWEGETDPGSYAKVVDLRSFDPTVGS